MEKKDKSGTVKSGGARGLQKRVKVKSRAKRTKSSAQWLERQLNDPYVVAAKAAGYRSRAAFKIIQMDDELRLFRKGQRVVDLGAAPGGWTQIAVDRVGSLDEKSTAKVIGIDYLNMADIPGATFICLDFTDDTAPDVLKHHLDGHKADIVMSDMAPPTIGHKQTDHLRIMALVEMAYDFAREVLVPGGVFLSKVFMGGADKELLDMLKADFDKVKHIKPPASRKDSSEMYVVAIGFKGGVK